jgi:hypothetical protein
VKVDHPALPSKEQTVELQDGESQPDTDFILPLETGGLARGRQIG